MPKIGVEFVVLRNNIPLPERLQAVAGSPATVSFQGDGETKMTLTATFLPFGGAIDPATDHVRPYLLLDGERRPMGEYVLTTLPENRDGPLREIAATCYDLSYLCRLRKVETRPFWVAGTKYTAIFEEILILCGLTRYRIAANPAVLATDREDWEPGTEWLTVLNDLAAEINYRSLYIDMEGVAVLEAPTAPDAAQIRHRYKTDAASILDPALTVEEDRFDAPNVFIVLCENPDYAKPLRAEAVNADPADPLSVPHRGRVPEIVFVDNIADQEALQAYADNLRMKSLVSKRTLSSFVGYDKADAARNPFDVTELVWEGESYLLQETAWTAALDHTGGFQLTGEEMVYH